MTMLGLCYSRLIILNFKEVCHENVKRIVAYGICRGCNAAKRNGTRAGQHAAAPLYDDERWKRPDAGINYARTLPWCDGKRKMPDDGSAYARPVHR
jgi:hypothetical protein